MDHVIVITGASSGIGAALAEEVSRRGAKVVLAARREPELTALAARLGNAHAVVMDVTKRADNERLRDEALATFGHIDVWVNNAGRGMSRMPSELTDEDIDDMMAVNLKSVLYGIQASLPHMKQRKRGQIMTVSSGLARIPFAPIRAGYAASKAAVNLLMASLRGELRTEYPDIHATTVMPGIVATEFGSSARHGGPDSRTLPGAQPVAEVAVVMADAIETPRAELYSRPQMREMMGRYFSAEDVAPLEAQLAIPLSLRS